MCKALKDERCDKRAIQKSSTKIPQARYAGDGRSFEKINEEYCFFSILTIIILKAIIY